MSSHPSIDGNNGRPRGGGVPSAAGNNAFPQNGGAGGSGGSHASAGTVRGDNNGGGDAPVRKNLTVAVAKSPTMSNARRNLSFIVIVILLSEQRPHVIIDRTNDLLG
jgi:hypothetical protein